MEELEQAQLAAPDGDADARDLDDDVPDADAVDAEGWSDADMTEEEGALDPTTGEGVTLLEEGEGEVDGFTAAASGVGMVVGEGDLDDEVPEADVGAYEHTDTEAEGSISSEEVVVVGSAFRERANELEEAQVQRTQLGRERGRGPVMGTFRTSGQFGRGGGGSVFGSSPAAGPSGRGGGRGRGREN